MKFGPIKFVDNISEVLWMHWSTKAMTAAAGIPLLWMLLPTTWQEKYFWDWIPQYMAYLTIGLGFLSIFLKLVKQKLPSDNKANTLLNTTSLSNCDTADDVRLHKY